MIGSGTLAFVNACEEFELLEVILVVSAAEAVLQRANVKIQISIIIIRLIFILESPPVFFKKNSNL
jgi:hypothetical protein